MPLSVDEASCLVGDERNVLTDPLLAQAESTRLAHANEAGSLVYEDPRLRYAFTILAG